MTVSLSANELAERIRSRLAGSADPDFAAGQQRFFQHQVRTYGVRTRQLHALDREFWRAVKALPLAARNSLMNALWRDPHLESGILACYLYRRFESQCGRCEFRLFERWIDRYVRNWAHCDAVSSWLLAASISNEPELRFSLTAWTAAPNLWKRRAAAVALLQEAKHGRHTDFLFSIATPLLPDPELMVQKGVGWLLKETYPARPRETVAFLLRQRHTASRLTLRYAAEKMTPADRKLVLA
jgi:3-methyladenine DNA glycosylase AlkD